MLSHQIHNHCGKPDKSQRKKRKKKGGNLGVNPGVQETAGVLEEERPGARREEEGKKSWLRLLLMLRFVPSEAVGGTRAPRVGS